MSKKKSNPTILIELEITEKMMPEIHEVLAQGQFQAKLDIIRWWEKNQESDTPYAGKISVKIPR